MPHTPTGGATGFHPKNAGPHAPSSPWPAGDHIDSIEFVKSLRTPKSNPYAEIVPVGIEDPVYRALKHYGNQDMDKANRKLYDMNIEESRQARMNAFKAVDNYNRYKHKYPEMLNTEVTSVKMPEATHTSLRDMNSPEVREARHVNNQIDDQLRRLEHQLATKRPSHEKVLEGLMASMPKAKSTVLNPKVKLTDAAAKSKGLNKK